MPEQPSIHSKKYSRQRELVLNILRSTKSHPTAEWIYKQARTKMPRISLGTVYRNLSVLRDEGRIQEICVNESVRRYDGDVRDHYHVHCIQCGCIDDVPPVAPRMTREEMESITGYKIMGHRLEFWGICKACQSSSKDDDFGG